MYVLDTDTLTHLFAGHPRVLARRSTVPSSEIAIAVVTRIEVLQGRFDFLLRAASGEDLLRAQSWLDQSLASLAQVETILPIDDVAAAEFDRLRQTKGLRRIGRADLLIAAISLANKATLVSRNERHFGKVPGLILENSVD